MGKELAQEELDQILSQYETSTPSRSGGRAETSTSGAGLMIIAIVYVLFSLYTLLASVLLFSTIEQFKPVEDLEHPPVYLGILAGIFGLVTAGLLFVSKQGSLPTITAFISAVCGILLAVQIAHSAIVVNYLPLASDYFPLKGLVTMAVFLLLAIFVFLARRS
ncbi:MAG: hypothetical protein VX188_00825 [Candidatus Thermoplasmatota archaeon]|nr:hypothetical protein [Candidatus Thermoplasmatota archaeon]